jgi:pyrroline-5-carboxylate reductase
MTQPTTRLAVIGGGNMGEALLAGLLTGARATYQPEWITVVEPDAGRAAHLRDAYGVRVTDPVQAVREADTVLIIVKPYVVDTVLTRVGDQLTDDHLVISAAGGISTAHIESRLAAKPAVVRTMPNTAVAVGEGMIALTAGAHAGPAHLDRAEALMRPLGRVVRVTEPQLDAVTALSGSGPAYFFLLAEALVDSGILLGLPRGLADELVRQTAAGAGIMLRDSGTEPALLRAAVCSPGGTTIAAIREFENRGLRSATMAAALAARDRSVAQGQEGTA